MFSYRIDEHLSLTLTDPQQAEDVARVVRANLDHLKPWMPWAVDDYSADTAKWFIERFRQKMAETGEFGAGIVSDEEFIGVLGFHHLDEANRSAWLRYWISKEYEGRGIVTRCCRVLVNYLFDTMQLNRVQINCNVENTRSRAIPERLGFKLEGINRQVEWLNGRFGDWAVYAMLQEEWAARESE